MTCDVVGSSDGGPGSANGSCTYFCDGARANDCPVGYSCHGTRVGGDNGTEIQICRKSGASSSLDAGAPGTVPPGYLPDGGFDPNFDGGTDGGVKQQ
jgi:hypothetical protein